MASEDDFLAQEYLHIQKVIEDYDTKTLTIKAWSVTFSAAAIGLAYDKRAAVLLMASIISALSFWLVESLMKVNQLAYYGRATAIEGHFASQSPEPPFQIGRFWYETFSSNGKYGRAARIMLWPHVFMPHLAIAGIGAILLVLRPPA